MAVSLHYFRGGHQVSSSKATVLFTGQTVLAVFGLLAVLPASAQYPGQVAKSTKDAPELRAVGVLEWTGEASKPKASRLVPITVFDGGELQDGGIYLARPAPMALAGEVEYQLEINGKTIGLFDISGAGRDQGSWVGFGTWKPLPAAKIKSAATDWSKERVDEGNSDQPVLHRKAHPGDKPAGGSDTGGRLQPATPIGPPSTRRLPAMIRALRIPTLRPILTGPHCTRSHRATTPAAPLPVPPPIPTGLL